MRCRYAGACEVCAFAFDGVVEMLGKGIVDDSNQRLEIVREGERDADVGVGVDEVCSAIYWVDYEGGRRCERTAG